MIWQSLLQLATLVGAIILANRFLGPYLADVFASDLTGRPPRAERWFAPIESRVFTLCGIDPEREQRWTTYALSLLAFSLVSVLGLYVLQRLQGHLLLNPTHTGAPSAPLAWSTPRSASSPTPTGRTTRGESTMATSPRWPAWPCRTSCRPRPAWRWRSR